MDLSDLDNETARMILQLQLEDLQELADTDKGKQPEGNTSDKQLAAQAYEAELRMLQSSFEDLRMGQSMTLAVMTDAELLQQIDATEGPEPADQTTNEAMSDEQLQRLEARYVWDGSNAEALLDQGESSEWAVRRKASVFQPDSRCDVCGDEFKFFDVARCPCGHNYCAPCLKNVFEAACADEALFPPRCCKQPISADENAIMLGQELVSKFKATEVEFNTKDRTYCHDATCSAFIPTTCIENDVGTCPRCARETCVFCKARSHGGNCSQDQATQQLLELAAGNGWQTCRQCNRVLELTYGCHHMTCPCGAQFCYVCGETWKTCPCDQWDEHRLVERAEQLADRHQEEPLGEAQWGELVAAERQNLIDNHECNHESWRSLTGRHLCEECHDSMPYFAYECRQCHIVACRRCRYNRL